MATIYGFNDIDISLEPRGGFITISQFDPILDRYVTVKVPVDLWRVIYQSGLNELGGSIQ